MKMRRTTIDLPEDLYTQAKMMALLINRPLAHLFRIALSDKIKQLKDGSRGRGDERSKQY